METVTIDHIEKHTARYGAERTSRLLSILGKDRRFTDAWESTVGKELMEYLLAMADDRLTKIFEETADEKEKAEFRVCKELLGYFQARILLYIKHHKQLTRGGK